MRSRILFAAVLLLFVAACAPASVRMPVADAARVESADPDRAVMWVRSSAEFEALSYQAYSEAQADLPRFIADTSWSALPWQTDAADLAPAIITDVDETMVTNVEFQASFEPPFSNAKLDRWNASTVAEALPGAVAFIKRAQDAGVRIFFVTNRPCEAQPGVDDACPQKAVTIKDLNEAGFDADESNVLLADKRLGWSQEKALRRRHIAETHRVIMLIGDDLGDFIPCTRSKPLAPCADGASIGSRAELTREYARYWGNGLYILPNPMHGSWTTVE
jgi:acid phosphatase